MPQKKNKPSKKLRQSRHWPKVNKGPDPLVRKKRSLGKSLLVWALLMLGASMAHAGIAGVFMGAQKMFDKDREIIKEEKITVAIVTENETPPPKPMEEPILDDKEEAPPPKPLPKPKIKRFKEPKVDPIDKQEKPPEPNKAPPRKIVGLDFSSTVQGGKGPGFATGNTRMGQTSGKAANPNEVVASAQLPKEKVNRQAQYIPTSKAKLIKPKIKNRLKPKYPALYNEQRLVALVVIEVNISKDGNVTSAKLLKKSKHELFNQEALKAARNQKFAPATKDGVPMSFRIQLPYRFEPPD